MTNPVISFFGKVGKILEWPFVHAAQVIGVLTVTLTQYPLVRTAVIGVGAMGRNHARVYSEMPGVELVGVADADARAAQTAAGRFGGKAYSDYGQMLDETKPEAVTLAVPPPEAGAAILIAPYVPWDPSGADHVNVAAAASTGSPTTRMASAAAATRSRCRLTVQPPSSGRARIRTAGTRPSGTAELDSTASTPARPASTARRAAPGGTDRQAAPGLLPVRRLEGERDVLRHRGDVERQREVAVVVATVAGSRAAPGLASGLSTTM